MSESSAPSSNVTPFGKYLLDEEIARGGMAKVFLARLRGLGGFEKRLVVKQILPELATDPRFVEMFVEEAKTVVRMSHPNVVPVYELGVVDGVYFLAMEFVEGATLREILQLHGALTTEQAVHVVVQVCDALHYASDTFDLVHRDVTPRNIMVDRRGHVRLLDFGIARKVRTEGGPVFGSPGYMSPEQARGDAMDSTSDLFSVGCILFESLVGEPVFGHSQKDGQWLLAPSPSLTELDEFPETLRNVVQELLEYDRQLRPADAGTVSTLLRSWLGRMAGGNPGNSFASVVDQAVSKRPKMQSSPPPASRPTPGRETTLATNPALQELIGGTVPIAGRVRKGAKRARMVVAAFVLAAACAAATAAFMLRSATPEAPGTHAAVTKPRTSRPEDSKPSIPSSVLPQDKRDTPSAQKDNLAKETVTRAQGTLTVSATPWAEVHLSGKRLGTTPLRRASAAAGVHTLLVACPPLGKHAKLDVHIEPDEHQVVFVDLTQDPPVTDIR